MGCVIKTRCSASHWLCQSLATWQWAKTTSHIASRVKHSKKIKTIIFQNVTIKCGVFDRTKLLSVPAYTNVAISSSSVMATPDFPNAVPSSWYSSSANLKSPQRLMPTQHPISSIEKIQNNEAKGTRSSVLSHISSGDIANSVITYIVNFNLVVESYTTMLSIFVENREWHDNAGVLYYCPIYQPSYASFWSLIYWPYYHLWSPCFTCNAWCYKWTSEKVRSSQQLSWNGLSVDRLRNIWAG